MKDGWLQGCQSVIECYSCRNLYKTGIYDGPERSRLAVFAECRAGYATERSDTATTDSLLIDHGSVSNEAGPSATYRTNVGARAMRTNKWLSYEDNGARRADCGTPARHSDIAETYCRRETTIINMSHTRLTTSVTNRLQCYYECFYPSLTVTSSGQIWNDCKQNPT